MQPKYRFNPSLLGKFQDLIDSDLLWEKFYGGSEEPKHTPEEFYFKQEQELLDAINRVEKEPSEAASKGTALNAIVDSIVAGEMDGEDTGSDGGFFTEWDGFEFTFSPELCIGLADHFKDAICQHLCEAEIQTSFGPVILYGYADYIQRDTVFDLKSTSEYSYGKFARGWQKDLYPYCLVQSGEMADVSGFEYTVALLSGGNSRNPVISGTIYREWYNYSHEDAKARLRGISESFILWIEKHREEIHHKRIFNQI